MRTKLVSLLVAVPMMLVAGSASASDTDCRPSYLRMSDEVIEDQWHDVDRTVAGIVIGCAEALESVGEDEAKELEELLRQVLAEEGLNLMAKQYERSFGEELAGRINKLLGRHVATDVFLFHISYSE